MSRFFSVLLCAVIPLFALLGCETSASSLNPGQVLGRDHVIGEPGPGPGRSPTGERPANPSGPTVGDSCRSDSPQRICLGLRYVVYRDAIGEPVLSSEDATKNLKTINGIWGQCNIGFQIDELLAVRPQDFQLYYQTAHYSELEEIRNIFSQDNTLLIVTTGPWDRTGSLGSTGANAWTAMPGGGPFGVVMERPVATFANIIAHELGHYLNLLHVSDAKDIMNPVIYSGSTQLTSAQCERARAAASFFWRKMYR